MNRTKSMRRQRSTPALSNAIPPVPSASSSVSATRSAFTSPSSRSPLSDDSRDSLLIAAGLDEPLPPLPRRGGWHRAGSDMSVDSTLSSDSETSAWSEWSESRKHYACKACQALITFPESVLSNAFNGFRGKASLVNNVDIHNVNMSAPSVQLMHSGAYTIRETSCKRCQSYLGWKIVRAHEWAEKWKEGDYLFEMEALVLQDGDEPDVSDAKRSGTLRRRAAAASDRLSRFVKQK